jgi:signal transduction histidine kinase
MTTQAQLAALPALKVNPKQPLLRRILPKSIAGKLGSIVAIALLLIAGLSITLVVNAVALNTALGTTALLNEEAHRAQTLFFDIHHIADDLTAIIELNQIELIPEILAEYDVVLAEFSEYRRVAEENNYIGDIAFATENDSLFTNTRTDISNAVNLYRDGDTEQARTLKERIDVNVEQLEAGVQSSAEQRNLSLIQQMEQTSSLQRQLFVVTFSLVLAGGILLLVVSFTYTRSIVRNLKQLSASTLKLVSGNYEHRAHVTTSDEVGQLAGAFNKMAEAVEYRDKVQIVKLEEQLVEVEAARAQAERSDKVKSAFLASMSHELRTPLNAVINFTLFVVEGDTGAINEQQAELLREVVNSANHLLALINDVLDMSKIEAGSLNLFIEDNINLNNLINNVVSSGRGLVGNKSVSIQTAVDNNLPLIRADRQRVLQILLNIMSNACKFTEAGEIRVNAQRNGDEVLISISDTGPGIADEDKTLVFEPFRQTRTGLRQGGGTGLGMPIAKRLTEAHGGSLWLESEAGKGAVFHVSLPVKSPELVPIVA